MFTLTRRACVKYSEFSAARIHFGQSVRPPSLIQTIVTDMILLKESKWRFFGSYFGTHLVQKSGNFPRRLDLEEVMALCTETEAKGLFGLYGLILAKWLDLE